MIMQYSCKIKCYHWTIKGSAGIHWLTCGWLSTGMPGGGAEQRMLTKLMDNTSHLLHNTVESVEQLQQDSTGPTPLFHEHCRSWLLPAQGHQCLILIIRTGFEQKMYTNNSAQYLHYFIIYICPILSIFICGCFFMLFLCDKMLWQPFPGNNKVNCLSVMFVMLCRVSYQFCLFSAEKSTIILKCYIWIE